MCVQTVMFLGLKKHINDSQLPLNTICIRKHDIWRPSVFISPSQVRWTRGLSRLIKLWKSVKKDTPTVYPHTPDKNPRFRETLLAIPRETGSPEALLEESR